MARQPIERKVKASTWASAISGFIVWLLADSLFRGGQVPEPVQTLVYMAVPAVLTFLAGYQARHTPRPAPPDRRRTRRPRRSGTTDSQGPGEVS